MLLLVQVCHRSGSEADMELPALTQHDVECIRTFGRVGEVLRVGSCTGCERFGTLAQVD